jgi:hypothetical protein
MSILMVARPLVAISVSVALRVVVLIVSGTVAVIVLACRSQPDHTQRKEGRSAQ